MENGHKNMKRKTNLKFVSALLTLLLFVNISSPYFLYAEEEIPGGVPSEESVTASDQDNPSLNSQIEDSVNTEEETEEEIPADEVTQNDNETEDLETQVEELPTETNGEVETPASIDEEAPTEENTPIESEGGQSEVASTTPSFQNEVEENTATSTPVLNDSEATSTPTILTGESVALANVLNIVNTNFINSEGVIYFSNFLDYVNDSIDFRKMSPGAFGQNDLDLQVNVSNNATIENNLTVAAVSGENEIEGAENAEIKTGNAYAGLNLVNLANTNVVDTNYLLVTINAFKDVNGDIVFPNFSNLLSSLRSGGQSAEDALVQNEAKVETLVDAVSDSGGNEVEGAASSTINTGVSHSAVNVFNKINQTEIGDEQFSILLRVEGDWAGEVFGAPNDLSWSAGPGGVFLFSKASGSTPSVGGVHFEGENNAGIKNNVAVTALTGDNHIEAKDSAQITTGDSFVGANIINVANSNVVSKNWVMAIINIFGDFKGNIAFGRPDLWVGGIADTPGRIESGSSVTYHMSVINNGDSKATNVVLKNTFNSNDIRITHADTDFTTEGESVFWNIPEIPAGGAVEISYEAEVLTNETEKEIESKIEASSKETDDNGDDNSDLLVIRTSGKTYYNDEEDEEEEEEEEPVPIPETTINVQRLTRSATVSAKNLKVKEELTLENTGEEGSDEVFLYDVLRGPDGNVVQSVPFTIGKLKKGEKVTVSYDIDFSSEAKRGEYTLAATVTGKNISKVDFDSKGVIYFVEEDTHTEEENKEDVTYPHSDQVSGRGGIVLGASTEDLRPAELLIAEEAYHLRNLLLFILFAILCFGVVAFRRRRSQSRRYA